MRIDYYTIVYSISHIIKHTRNSSYYMRAAVVKLSVAMLK